MCCIHIPWHSSTIPLGIIMQMYNKQYHICCDASKTEDALRSQRDLTSTLYFIPSNVHVIDHTGAESDQTPQHPRYFHFVSLSPPNPAIWENCVKPPPAFTFLASKAKPMKYRWWVSKYIKKIYFEKYSVSLHIFTLFIYIYHKCMIYGLAVSILQ